MMDLCNSSALIHCQVYGRQSAWEGWGPTTPACAKLLRECGNVQRDYSYGPKERMEAIRQGAEAGRRWRRAQGLGLTRDVQGLGAANKGEALSRGFLIAGTASLLAGALAMTYWSERDADTKDPWLWVGVAGLGLGGALALASPGGA